MSLLLPALRLFSTPQRPVVFVRPPHVLYSPGLVNAGLPLSHLVWIGVKDDIDGRWAAEQALRSGAAGAVVIWTETRAEVALRRLQLAAAETESLAFVYRPPAALRNSSPAAVRLALHADPTGMRIEVLKVSMRALCQRLPLVRYHAMLATDPRTISALSKRVPESCPSPRNSTRHHELPLESFG